MIKNLWQTAGLKVYKVTQQLRKLHVFSGSLGTSPVSDKEEAYSILVPFTVFENFDLFTVNKMFPCVRNFVLIVKPVEMVCFNSC